MTEEQFQRQIIDLAELLGWLAYHTHNSLHSEPGYPDLTLVRGDRLIFAELKTDKGTVSPAQERWLNKLAKTPAETYIWRPRDWAELQRILTPDYTRPPAPAEIVYIARCLSCGQLARRDGAEWICPRHGRAAVRFHERTAA